MIGRLVLGIGVGCAVMASHVAAAQDFPTRPIRIIVPYSPGGTADGIVRPIAQELSKALGQQVVVENKPGAGTVIGVDSAAKAPPDGYSFVVVSNSFAINTTLVPKLPYDTLKDLRAVGLMTKTSNVLVANPRTPGKDLRELVAFAKTNPGKLTYGSPGAGTSQHLAGELFKAVAEIDLLHVPYKGGAPAITDLLGGQIDLFVANLPEALNHIRAGKLKAYGVSSSRRSELAPDLPTIAEQGYAGFETTTWFGLLAPATVPDKIVDRMNTELGRVLSQPAIRSAFGERGLDPSPGTAEDFAAFIRAEIARNALVIKAANIKLDQ